MRMSWKLNSEALTTCTPLLALIGMMLQMSWTSTSHPKAPCRLSLRILKIVSVVPALWRKTFGHARRSSSASYLPFRIKNSNKWLKIERNERNKQHYQLETLSNNLKRVASLSNFRSHPTLVKSLLLHNPDGQLTTPRWYKSKVARAEVVPLKSQFKPVRKLKIAIIVVRMSLFLK